MSFLNRTYGEGVALRLQQDLLVLQNCQEKRDALQQALEHQSRLAEARNAAAPPPAAPTSSSSYSFTPSQLAAPKEGTFHSVTSNTPKIVAANTPIR